MSVKKQNGVELTTVKGVLFDLDNTLVSCTMNFKEMRRRVGCPEGVDILSHVSGLSMELQRQAHQAIKQIEVDDAANSIALNGAVTLLSFLKDLGIPTAIITRNCLEASLIKLERTNIKANQLITREDFPAKPDPSALLHIANLWGAYTQELLFVGDFKYDLEAAKNAYMPSCLVHNIENNDFAHLASITSKDLITLTQDLKPFIHRN